jgi:cytochrome P450
MLDLAELFSGHSNLILLGRPRPDPAASTPLAPSINHNTKTVTMTIDQTPGYHLCLALIALGLVLWSGHDLFQSATGPNPPITALVRKGVLLLVFVKLLSVCIRKFNFYRRARSLGCGAVPVYPHKDPILGLDLFLQALPHLKSHTVSQWMSKRMRTYGHTHFHRALGEWIILTDEPLNIKGALATNFNDWPIGGPRLAAALPILGPNSVFTSNGQAWHINRAMIRPAFDRNLVSDMECFSRHTWNMVQRIPKDGSTFDMQRLLQDMTMDSATDFLLDHSTGMLTDTPVPGAEAFIKAFQEASDECATKARISPILLKLPNKKLDANITTIRDFVRFYLRKAVAEHEQRQERGERRRGYVFLDVLLDKDLSEEYLTDQVLSVLIAGRDTTAMAITVCFWYLAHNPRVVEKLRREILSVKEPTWWALRDMKYLNRVIKEGMSLINLYV